MSERPADCRLCQKQIKVIYKKEGEGGGCLKMCKDCPLLEEQLQEYSELLQSLDSKEINSHLHCAHCFTTLEAIKTGRPLGCPNCYSIFGDILIDSLLLANKPFFKKSPFDPLNIEEPQEKPITSPSSTRASFLNEALNEALKKENYEQAALLRDQIKELI